MSVIITFEDEKAEMVELIGEITGNKQSIPLSWVDDDLWAVELDLNPGEFQYNFLIDGLVEIVDPLANKYSLADEDKLMSVINIDDNGNWQDFMLKTPVKADELIISKELYGEEITRFRTYDEKVVVYLSVEDVYDLHQINFIWYEPHGYIFYETSSILWQPANSSDKKVIVWSWFEIASQIPPLVPGEWAVRVFIDGKEVAENFFYLKGTLYNLNGGKVTLK